MSSVRAALVASLVVTLSGLPAFADKRPSPRVPRATLVEVLRGGKQVLVLDRTTGDYAVLKVGDKLQGFRISAIEDDQMILVGAGKPQRTFIIPLLDRSPLPPMKAPLTAGGEPADPYAAPAAPAAPSAPAAQPASPAPAAGEPAGDDAVMDPYGPSAIPAPTPTPPAAPAPTPAPAAEKPAPATATPPAPAAEPPPAPAAEPPPAPAAASATPAPAAARAAKPRTEKRRLSRKELNRALSDFAALTREIKIERATGGGIVVTDLAKGSLAARAGIEKGDVVRRVAGHAIDTVDDAASAYAAVFASKQVVVELERRGARLHITYQLTD